MKSEVDYKKKQKLTLVFLLELSSKVAFYEGSFPWTSFQPQSSSNTALFSIKTKINSKNRFQKQIISENRKEKEENRSVTCAAISDEHELEAWVIDGRLIR